MRKGRISKTRGESRKPAGVRRGRFKAGMDPLFASFNASISFDKRLVTEDVRGSIAHARMLGRQGIIPADDSAVIEAGLKEVLADIQQGKLQFREELEDVHINIEEALREKVGDAAGKLHTARSRNDQIALDLRLYLREQIRLILADLMNLAEALVDKSDACLDVIMPGYTHLQRAQPVRVSHHLMAYFQMVRRDAERFADCLGRLDGMPLGSAALAGTTFPIDRGFVAAELGFSRVCENSLDAVSDRDFALEFLFDAAMVMMHLSRLAEELVIWSSSEFGFCTLPDEYCSGSSIMPQKKNPDACELIRGKTGRVYGDLVALLTTMKALPLTYNKDLQEDKEPVFDAVDTVRGSVRIMAGLLPGVAFHAETMLRAASDPSLAATDIADRLVREGLPFREAHARTGELVRARLQRTSTEITVDSVPGPEEMVEARNHIGGTSRDRVIEQIRAARSFLKEHGHARSGRRGRAKRGNVEESM
ncbi:MAG: argininosuccinate lyase [Desulfomonile tiedjei]|nr:argininosuccinate lyase [Desulfomonile tiedjei]